MWKLNINIKNQLLRTIFLTKFGSLDLYDDNIKEIFIIDHEELQFIKIDEWTLIGTPGEPNGLMFDHEYFCIHSDLFGRAQSTYQETQ